jgi:regulator of sigma E protease
MYYTVERNGEILDIPIPGNLIDRMGDKNVNGFIDIATPVKVHSIQKGSNAEKAGLQEGDHLLRVNNQDTRYFPDFQNALMENLNQVVNLEIERAGEIKTIDAKVSEEGTLGFIRDPMIEFGTSDFTLGESIKKGTTEAFQSAWVNIRGVGKLFTGEVSFSSMKGPMGIAQIYSGTWNWNRFWVITGVLSMWLAFVNFLPIPALDGGHVAFLSYEIVSGRKPSDSFLENSQKVGMVLLLTLMAAVIFNDVFQTFFN